MQMLSKELKAEKYNKAAVTRELREGNLLSVVVALSKCGCVISRQSLAKKAFVISTDISLAMPLS